MLLTSLIEVTDLITDPDHQKTVKQLTSRVATIYRRDMLTEDQVAGAKSHGNYDQQCASVEIPWTKWHFSRPRELIIISYAPGKAMAAKGDAVDAKHQ